MAESSSAFKSSPVETTGFALVPPDHAAVDLARSDGRLKKSAITKGYHSSPGRGPLSACVHATMRDAPLSVPGETGRIPAL